jgi:hypothetical protein
VTYFAIPDGAFSPAEAELASILDYGAMQLTGFEPLGLAFIARDRRVTVVLIAMAIGFDADGWWSR